MVVNPDLDILVKGKRQANDKAQANLPNNLETPRQAIFIVLKFFEVVVDKANHARPDGRDDEQDNINVGQVGKEEYRNE